MHHLIKRQIFSLTLSTERNAFELQHLVSQANQREVLPLLEKLLDEICTDEQVVYIPRLEIDLGPLPMKELINESWIPLLEARIRQQLQKMMETGDGNDAVLVRHPRRSGVFRQWLFSMQHGYLPWNAGKTDDGWYLQVLEAVATDVRIAEELRSVLARDSIAAERVVKQHSVSFLIALTESLTAERQDRLNRAVEEIWMLVEWLMREEGLAHEGGLIREEGQVSGLTYRMVEVKVWKKILWKVVSPVVSTTAPARLTTGVLLTHLLGAFFSPRQVERVFDARWPGMGLSVLPSVLEQVRRGVDPDEATEGEYFIADASGRKKDDGLLREKVDEPGMDAGPDRGAGRKDEVERRDPGNDERRAGLGNQKGEQEGRGDQENRGEQKGRVEQEGRGDQAVRVDQEGLGEQKGRVDQAKHMDQKEPVDQADKQKGLMEQEARVDHADEADRARRMGEADQAGQAEEVGRVGRTDGSEQMDQAGRVGPVDQADRARQVEETDRMGHTDGSNRTDQTGRVDGREQTKRTDGARRMKTPAGILGDEEIFIDNAGVILLHPFLHSFFKILDYVEGGKFRTPELHTNALYLLHFLATGRTEAHEHEMVIAKVLCAYPLDEPVDRDVQLTSANLREADDLLTAAIARWEILKSTSHAGLREGFLQRSGKLQAKGNDLYLQVETSSIDILLDHLPWNLGIIKLPWMDHILRAEWR